MQPQPQRKRLYQHMMVAFSLYELVESLKLRRVCWMNAGEDFFALFGFVCGQVLESLQAS